MKMNIKDKASTRKLKSQEKFSVRIHCHKVCEYAFPAGADCRNCIPISMVIIAAMLTVPAPIQAILLLDSFLPARDNTRNPAKGNAGINASILFILHCLY